ncbi:hypothetical protein P4S72_03730 [Vibrio sp. PP-XX7]
MDDHEAFTQLNDAILFHFSSFNAWEQAYLTDLQYKMIHNHLVSEKQKH